MKNLALDFPFLLDFKIFFSNFSDFLNAPKLCLRALQTLLYFRKQDFFIHLNYAYKHNSRTNGFA